MERFFNFAEKHFMKQDFLVVGLGLSGLAICEELEKRGHSFRVYEDNSQKSSFVAGGIFNPVILKRFTLAWDADEQLKVSIPFYQSLEQKLHIPLVHFWNIFRRFHSVEEQNNWFVATDKERLGEFLDTKLHQIDNPHISAPYSYGKVQQTGHVDTGKMLDAYRKYLAEKNSILFENFDYDQLQLEDGRVKYQDGHFEAVIFCEGFGLRRNPYFQYLPLRGNKGEYITIRSRELQLKEAIKSSVFILPLGDDLYKVGATYDNQDKSPEITSQARERLVQQVRQVINCDFEVVDQVAGIRPAMIDRRPIIGRHPEHSNLYCCNGFGSRGVLAGPVMARQLLDFIDDQSGIDAEVDLNRFTKKYFQH